MICESARCRRSWIAPRWRWTWPISSSHYGSQSLEQFDLSGALNEMTEIIRRYGIMLPPRVAMLIKVLVTLEGTAQLLSPKFSLLEVMARQKKMLWRRFSPARRLRKLGRLYGELEHLPRCSRGSSRSFSKCRPASSTSTWTTADWSRRSTGWCWGCWPARCSSARRCC